MAGTAIGGARRPSPIAAIGKYYSLYSFKACFNAIEQAPDFPIPVIDAYF